MKKLVLYVHGKGGDAGEARKKIGKALFISPVADMEKLILDMMAQAKITETLLKENGEHWFHTPEQMEFWDNWIIESIKVTHFQKKSIYVWTPLFCKIHRVRRSILEEI